MDEDEYYTENIPPNSAKFTKRGIFAFYKQLDGNLFSYAIVGLTSKISKWVTKTPRHDQLTHELEQLIR
jgi:hypothetical protein